MYQGDEMVRFSSNLKRPKAVVKQSTPLLSKEAPASNISAAALHHQKRLQQASHSHSRSLPTNSTSVTQQEEIGLSSGQALKKLIEEIDRILKQQYKSSKNNIKSSFILRFASLLLLAALSIFKLRNWYLGLFCSLVFIIEFFFIEIIEKKRATGVVRDSINEIRKKMRALDKAILAGTVDIDELYSIVPVTYLVFLFIYRISKFHYHQPLVTRESLETEKFDLFV